MNLRNPKIYSAPKEEKEKHFPKFIIIFCLFIIIVMALGYLLFFSNIFVVKNITLSSNVPEEAQNYLNQFKNKNIFLIKSNDIAEELKNQYPEYLDIEVYKGIPDILKVDFSERRAALVWQSQSDGYLVDSTGLAFKKINIGSRPDLISVIDNKNLPVNVPAQVVTATFINFITNAKAKLQSANIEVKEFQINETIFQVDALTTGNLKIIFDITRSVSDQIDAFTQVYNDHKNDIKQYIDVRVPGKVYYQ